MVADEVELAVVEEGPDAHVQQAPQVVRYSQAVPSLPHIKRHASHADKNKISTRYRGIEDTLDTGNARNCIQKKMMCRAMP